MWAGGSQQVEGGDGGALVASGGAVGAGRVVGDDIRLCNPVLPVCGMMEAKFCDM